MAAQAKKRQAVIKQVVCLLIFDSHAWNGLGSVALLQEDPERALVYIDRALELLPNYAAAKHDRKLTVQMLRDKDKNNAKRTP